jgi:hypothetical protein
MKSIAPGLVLIILFLPFPAAAILLDCEINAERIYTCVEIGASATAADDANDKEAYGEEYRRYIEQAKQNCVYSEPRRRTAGKNNTAALRVEELKSAQADYEQCISETARDLWRKNNPPGTSKP